MEGAAAGVAVRGGVAGSERSCWRGLRRVARRVGWGRRAPHQAAAFATALANKVTPAPLKVAPLATLAAAHVAALAATLAATGLAALAAAFALVGRRRRRCRRG